MQAQPQSAFIAIAKAESADVVYSDDSDILKYAKDADLRAYRSIDLDLPPEDPQMLLNLEDDN